MNEKVYLLRFMARRRSQKKKKPTRVSNKQFHIFTNQKNVMTDFNEVQKK